MSQPAAALRFAEHREMIDGIEELVPGKFYALTYRGDYALEDVLKAGLVSVSDAGKFAAMKWLDPRKATMLFQVPKNGCSAFQCRTPEGHFLFGRNYDITHEPMTALLVNTAPENGYKSLGIADLGWLGMGEGSLSDGKTDLSLLVLAPYLIMDGMNEKGLCVSVLSLKDEPRRQNTGKAKINTTTALRLMLDRAATVKEALELLAGYDMQAASPKNNYHFLIADRNGRSVAVEYVENELRVNEAAALTNHYISPGARPRIEGGNSANRLDAILAVQKLYGDRMTAGDAMSLLRLVAQSPERERRSLTRWSEVFDQKTLTLDVAIAREYDRILQFSL